MINDGGNRNNNSYSNNRNGNGNRQNNWNNNGNNRQNNRGYEGHNQNNNNRQNNNQNVQRRTISDFQNFDLFDQNNKISENLLSDTAESIAKSFSGDSDVFKYGKYIIKGVSERQFRKIFDEIKTFDRKASEKKMEWDDLRPNVEMLKSKVVYAMARACDKAKNDEITVKGFKNFEKFINCGLAQINSVESFHVFCVLTEAVYGFYYAIKANEQNN